MRGAWLRGPWGALGSEGGSGATWPVVPRENGQRLRMGLTCGSRLSEVKKRKGEGRGCCGGLAFAGPVRSPGLGPVGLPKPFFSLKCFSFLFSIFN
jgi:hypothetical protein